MAMRKAATVTKKPTPSHPQKPPTPAHKTKPVVDQKVTVKPASPDSVVSKTSTTAIKVEDSKNTKPNNIHVDIDAKKVNVGVDVSITPKPATTKVKLNIFDAIQAKNFDDIRKYVAAGGDANVRSKSGDTPLFTALQKGWKDLDVKMLLTIMKGVDFSLHGHQDYNGTNKHSKAIDFAVQKHNPELLNVLLEHAGKIKINQEISFNVIQNLNPKDKMFINIILHTDVKEYNNNIKAILTKISTSDNFELFKSVLNDLDPSTIKDDNNQFHLFHDIVMQNKNNQYIDLLLEKKIIGDYGINSTMKTLAIQNDQNKFKYIADKIEDKNSLIEFMNNCQKQISQYPKYMEMLGVSVFKDDPGTIYIDDVIDMQNGGSLLPGETIHTDSQFISNGHCVNVSVDVLPAPPVIVDDVVA